MRQHGNLPWACAGGGLLRWVMTSPPCAWNLAQIPGGWQGGAVLPSRLHGVHAAPGGLWRVDVPCSGLPGVAMRAPSLMV